MLLEYCVGMAVSQAGAEEAVSAEMRRDSTLPVSVWAEAAEESAG